MTNREKFAARSEGLIDRTVVRQARQARTRHTVKCILTQRKEQKRKPPKELYVDGTSRKTESFGKKNYKDTEETYGDVEETIEIQEARIKKYKSEGHRRFTAERRIGNLTVDVIFQARAKMVEERVCGHEDAIVT